MFNTEALVGIVAGLITVGLHLVFVRTAARAPEMTVKTVVILILEFLAMPGIWLGGTILLATILVSTHRPEGGTTYILSLTITVFILVMFPLMRTIVRAGNDSESDLDFEEDEIDE